MAQRTQAQASSQSWNQYSKRAISPHKNATIALIPAFNEERFIGSLVLTVQEYVSQVIVVDDGSADHTAQIARRAGAVVLRHQVNQGKAAAVNTGFNYLRQQNPAAVVMLDGDGQHSADDIPAVLAPVMEDGADIVVGSRFLAVKSDIPAYRQVGQHSLTLLTNLASGTRISDSQSGYRAFSARAIEALTFGQGGFSLESEMQFLANEHNLQVVEVPIKVTYNEPAKRNPVSHGVQVVNAILRLVGQTRPLLFFGGSGVLTLTAGVALGLVVVNIFARTRTLAIGYGLVTVILCVLGALLFFAGILLHSIRSLLNELRHHLVERLSAPQQRNVVHEHGPQRRGPAADAEPALRNERGHAS